MLEVKSQKNRLLIFLPLVFLRFTFCFGSICFPWIFTMEHPTTTSRTSCAATKPWPSCSAPGAASAAPSRPSGRSGCAARPEKHRWGDAKMKGLWACGGAWGNHLVTFLGCQNEPLVHRCATVLGTSPGGGMKRYAMSCGCRSCGYQRCAGLGGFVC